MFVFPGIAKDILQVILEAQDAGKPIALRDALKRWGNGSTWEDLVDGGYIYRREDGGVFATQLGRSWYEARAGIAS